MSCSIEPLNQNAWNSSNVITFFLAFEPCGRVTERMQDTLVNISREFLISIDSFFENWHASLHCNSAFAQLWLRFKVKLDCKSQLISEVETFLLKASRQLDFRLGGSCLQTEAQSFGEGDQRHPNNDIFSAVGGKTGMSDLWRQAQAATQWAVEDIQSGSIRIPPQEWHWWSRHIYCNLLCIPDF